MLISLKYLCFYLYSLDIKFYKKLYNFFFSFNYVFISLNNCFVSGGVVNRLTMMMENSEIKKAGSIPGIISSDGSECDSADATPSLSQMMTETVPVSIPAIAPHFVVRFHHSESIISGPNDAASPPHAKATKK